MNILMYIVILLGAILGIGTTVGIVGLMFVMIVYKFYRKIRYGISLYD